jgi:DNA-binding NtrC family response regulator/CHASE2 domain-containing sensor protein
MPITSRLFVRNIWLQAVLMALVATFFASIIWLPAPATYTALEWAPYDTWMRLRSQQGFSSSLLLAVRDQASERQWGAGYWDRGLSARLITALHDAGAAAVGVDIPLDLPSPPNLGGALSDALLIEAVKSAKTVVYPAFPILPPGEDGSLPLNSSTLLATGKSTIQPIVESDRTVRRAQLYQTGGYGELPAFGFTLASTFWNVPPDQVERRPGQVVLQHARRHDGSSSTITIPLDMHGRLLIDFAGHHSGRQFTTVSFLDLSRLIDKQDADGLAALVNGKVVILITQPSPQFERSIAPGGESSDLLIQAYLLRTLLAQDWIRELPPWQRLMITFVLCFWLAWMVLRGPDWKGLLLGGSGVLCYLASAFGILAWGHWILPFVIPVSAAVIVLVTTGLLGHVMAARRITLLEQDMLRIQQDLVAVREALVYRETAVETLEEDLESARASMSHAAFKQAASSQLVSDLQQKITDAQAQEAATRGRMNELEQTLRDMQAATLPSVPFGDVEQEAMRRECEQLGIVTRSPSILAMFRDLKKGARSTVTVLITGEPGTGKELFARAVHRLSPRAAKPFIAVNMAAISPELFESELFGHVRGSFTGALTDRKGYFELAHHGTIFLDEIGDLRLDHQSKLLRVLQDRTFYRVGASSPTTVDVRFVAATNKDLQRGVSEGWFREDLYFRLKGLVLHLPPLRDRSEDIPPLAGAFLQEIGKKYRHERVHLSEEAMTILRQQFWKGNIRELRQCLEQAVTLSDAPILTIADLRLQSQPSLPAVHQISAEPILPDPAGDVAVLHHLRRYRFDMQATAKALGWDRSTVTQRLKGLCFQALVESEGDQAKAASVLAGDSALLRTVELKVMDYMGHLMETIQQFRTADEALLDCKRRFKNLPDRHFKSVEALVRKYFSTHDPKTRPSNG